MRLGVEVAGRALELLPAGAIGRLARLHKRLPFAQRLTAGLRRAAGARQATLRHGDAAGLRLHSTATAAAYSFGAHELELQRALSSCLRPGDTLVDIGAHIGLMSLVGAREVGPAGRVYAFEPEPGSAEKLRRNASLNGFDHLEVIEKAAWSSRGNGSLAVPVGSPEHALVVEPGDHGSADPPWRVELAPLDELVADGTVAPPSVVKIDVQGAEAEVIRGMHDTLKRHRPLVICELHGTGATVRPLLHELGYEVEVLEEDSPSPHGDALWGAHLLARAASG